MRAIMCIVTSLMASMTAVAVMPAKVITRKRHLLLRKREPAHIAAATNK